MACAPPPAKDIGAQLFDDARTSDAESNTFACSTCHTVDDAAPAGAAGGSLTGVASRARFWGGNVTSLFDATNVCVTFFMRGSALTKTEPKSRALFEYLASISTTDATPTQALTIAENVTTLPRGRASAGHAVWDASCRNCHGDIRSGNGRISDSASLVPQASEEFAVVVNFPADLVITEKVRHGNFFGVGGTMPPFSLEVLSDAQLGDLLSYLGAKR